MAPLALALAVLATLGASDLRAQESEAVSWLAWSGCWVEVEAPADAPMTCIVPGDDGAALLTVTRAGVADRQRLDGAGVERAVDADGCVGVESTELSRDGARLFTSARLSCDGGTERSTRGLMAMVSPFEWIRVRALTVGQGSASWVTRYRTAPRSRVEAAGLTELAEATGQRGMAIETARMVASAAPSVDDIIEAHARTDAEAVRAWIVEQGSPIDLDAAGLLRLADAGVADAVIDVAVAVSYPDRFVVARQVEGDRLDDRLGAWDRYGYGYGARRCGLSSYYDPFFYGYQRYGYDPCYSSYGFSPYGYGRWSYGYGTPTVIVVQPVGEAQPRGRAVKGRGYTRSVPAATSGTSSSVRPSRPSSARAGQGYSGARSGAKASSSSGSSSSKGKAKPKGGG